MLPHLDPVSVIGAAGYAGIFLIIFAESGIFFCFFLPGDSLVFAAGLLAAGGVLNLWLLIALCVLAAIGGNSVGYWFGAWIEPRIFTKEDSFFFSTHYVARSEAFYEKYGPRAVVLARFIPVVRTFVPILAGIGSMRYGVFLSYNIIGGILWGAGVVLLGYYLGQTFPAAVNYLLPLSLLVIVISFLPIAREYLARR